MENQPVRKSQGEKGFALIPLLIILILAGTAGYWVWQKQSQTSRVPSNWQTYRNEKYRFEVNYPAELSYEFKLPSFGPLLESQAFVSSRQCFFDSSKLIKGCMEYNFSVQTNKIKILSNEILEKILNANNEMLKKILNTKLPTGAHTVENILVDDISAEKITSIDIPTKGRSEILVQFYKNGVWQIHSIKFNSSEKEKATKVFDQIISTFKFLK